MTDGMDRYLGKLDKKRDKERKQTRKRKIIEDAERGE